MIEERQKGVPEPAEHDALGVGVAQAAPRQERRIRREVRVQEFQGHDGAEEHRDQERDEGRNAVRVHEPGLDSRHGTGLGDDVVHGSVGGPSGPPAASYLFTGIMMCAPGVPGSISHGMPCPLSPSSRWLASDTPIDSAVAPGTDSTQSNWMRSFFPYSR